MTIAYPLGYTLYMTRPRKSTFNWTEYAEKIGLDPQVAREDSVTLKYAMIFASERFDGKRLRDLDPIYQRDLVIDAKDYIEAYQERNR